MAQSKQLADGRDQLKPSFRARPLIASWSSSESFASQWMRRQKAGNIQTGKRIPITALQPDVMALNRKGGGKTFRTHKNCLKSASRPMINMFLSSVQPALETSSILPKVVQNARESALFFRAERPAI
jgi:hypothetical protein